MRRGACVEGQDAPEVGADLLDEVHAAVTRYVVWPSAEAADAFTLFVVATHAQPAWEHATRFVLSSPVRRCGKTRAQEVARELVHQPLATTNISVPALVRSLSEEDPPTLILDEADAIFGASRRDRPEAAEDLRGILNTGHSRGWPYMRWDASSRRRDECPTFAMALLGGIGSLPDTIEDRAVVVTMRRRAPGESVEPFRSRRAVPLLRGLRERVHAWARDQLDRFCEAEPVMPVEDRDADKWEPLVAVADAAGGHWPQRARAACEVLCGQSNRAEDGTAGERLLADLYAVFGDADRLATATILARLNGIEEAPWGSWGGQPLTPRGLAKLLKPYGVGSRTVRDGPETAKGYAREDLADAWRRYVTSVTPSQREGTPAVTSDNSRDGSVTKPDRDGVTGHDQQLRGAVTDVTDVTAGRAGSPLDMPNHGDRTALLEAADRYGLDLATAHKRIHALADRHGVPYRSAALYNLAGER